MSKIVFINDKFVKSTQKQMEAYERKILTSYRTDKIPKRKLYRMASTRYAGRSSDIFSKFAHRVAVMVLGNSRRGN